MADSGSSLLSYAFATLPPQNISEAQPATAADLPVERGNAAAKAGTLGPAIETLVKATSAESAYCTLIDGQRGGFIIFDATDPAILPRA